MTSYLNKTDEKYTALADLLGEDLADEICGRYLTKKSATIRYKSNADIVARVTALEREVAKLLKKYGIAAGQPQTDEALAIDDQPNPPGQPRQKSHDDPLGWLDSFIHQQPTTTTTKANEGDDLGSWLDQFIGPLDQL